MNQLYYLCFSVNKLPDLTLTKYSVFDGSSVENIMDKHGVFLRQLHRLGYTSGVYFHLLYYYNPAGNITKGHHLSIIFYATSKDRSKLDGIREFLTTSVLSNYYEFFCYEIAKDFSVVDILLSDGNTQPGIQLTNISGNTKLYSLGKTKPEIVLNAKDEIQNGQNTHIVCEIASDADVMLSFNRMPVDERGRIKLNQRFHYGAFLTKKDYSLPAQNRLNTDEAGTVNLYSIMEWEPCETGRLYNVLKLMEGYNQNAVLRIDIFPVEHTQAIRQRLPYSETRRRISDRNQGKDDNSENIVKSWDKYLNNLMKFPQFLANVVALADSPDIAVMLADSVAAEAVESGTYLIEKIESTDGFDMYESDSNILHKNKDSGNYVAPFLSLYTLEEMRPMFSFPILYPGEAIECQKETDPIPFPKEISIDDDKGELHEVISLGTSSMGYDVTFQVKLFKKHAFIAGVPGAGKTNTMLYLVTTLWRDTEQKVPFLVLEPAKQEYRALAMIKGMEDLCVFSPGADTYFPLHINPFQFPVGLTLAEHIANLNAVFAGAFELIPPSPFLIDSCIEKVYLDKGWNINERNDGTKEYPTMQELYDSLKIAVEESGYEGESKANIRSVMEVRIGSLLRREIGHVYNVKRSIVEPEDWLNRPVIIELESLGEGPANFMSLLISTLIREVLKIRKTSDVDDGDRDLLVRSNRIQMTNQNVTLQTVDYEQSGKHIKVHLNNGEEFYPDLFKKDKYLVQVGDDNKNSYPVVSENNNTLLFYENAPDVIPGNTIIYPLEKAKREIEHIIFYEEAHNLIGPTTDDPVGGSVDPKISATKYLVKMLAEVRALGEGIVIADQLPTAMAPEVLKNTGLKLGHRITAQDDRNLLGSTMSASADQLEEQGTFGTGQALIFYENLLKPFKMRVCEWEKGVSQKKYDSPTNKQLFEHLKTNETYKALLKRSASIMQEKMKVEFDVYRQQAETVKKDINKKYAEITVVSGNIANLEKKLNRLSDANDIADTKKHIAEQKRAYEKKNAEFDGAVTRELKKLCWNYANLYYAYMTLSKNYSTHCDDMYMCTINNYLSLFGILRSLHDVPKMKQILLDETASVIKDIKRYVNFDFDENEGLLSNHTAYNNALFECGNYLINELDAKTDSFIERAKSILTLGDEAESEFREFGIDFSDSYFTSLVIAEKYYSIADSLSKQINEALSNDFTPDSREWQEANKRAVEYESKKKALYKAIAAFVVNVFRAISGASGLSRKALLTQTIKMLASFRKIIDYRNKYGKTILSDWSNYPIIWTGTNAILLMELSAKFAYLHQMRSERISSVHGNKLSEDVLTNICLQYNTMFQIYSGSRADTFDINYTLVNHYVRYLDSILRLGAYTHTVIAETSNGNWRVCSEFIKKLIQDERVSNEKKAEWNRLSVVMKSICDT